LPAGLPKIKILQVVVKDLCRVASWAPKNKNLTGGSQENYFVHKIFKISAADWSVVFSWGPGQILVVLGY
jgi:hypothetical protein